MMNMRNGEESERKEERRRFMNQVEQKFLMARMEELEARIRNNEEYWQQAKIANKAGKKFEEACNKGEGVLKAYDKYEEELSKTNCIYSEEAYKLGFEDGILMGMEREPDGRKSILSLEDMTAIVSVYDAIQDMKTTMLGSRKEYWEEGGCWQYLRAYMILLNMLASAKSG